MPLKVTLIARPTLTLHARVLLGDWRDDQGCGSPGEVLTEIAGRECYDSGGKGRSSADYHAHILDVDHGSVLEHAQYTFHVSGVSRALTHELVRHRVGVAISQRSTRYVDESEADYVTHPSLDMHGMDMGPVTLSRCAAREAYERLAQSIESALVSDGVDKLQARKQARGAARLELGNGLETSLIWSANLRALRHVIRMRGSDAADAEIRALAVALLEAIRPEAPAYFADYHLAPSLDGLGHMVEVHDELWKARADLALLRAARADGVQR